MSGYEHDVGRKECIWTVYMCTEFRLMVNLCKIIRDRKSRAITQTMHTNLVGLFCEVGYVDSCSAYICHFTQLGDLATVIETKENAV